ncbi:hypothetical protein JYU16_01400 [bacterium AH-315-M05]|nr:hypothetical protein [bacterium AH-315-M05]
MFKIAKGIFIIILILIFTSCGTDSGDSKEVKNVPSKTEAISMLQSVFIGSFSKQEIEENMNAVMTFYKLSIIGENYLRAGNTLATLRKESDKGVTEMDIIIHMIKTDSGWEGVSFDEQAKKSARFLEKKLAEKK